MDDLSRFCCQNSECLDYGKPMKRITSDEYAPYKTAILKAYGEEVVPPQTGKPGRPKKPYHIPSPELNYATVPKEEILSKMQNMRRHPRFQ